MPNESTEEGMGDVLEALATQIQSHIDDLNDTASLIEKVESLVESVLSSNQSLDADRGDLLQEGMLNTNILFSKCLIELQKSRIELEILRLAPELGGTD